MQRAALVRIAVAAAITTAAVTASATSPASASTPRSATALRSAVTPWSAAALRSSTAPKGNGLVGVWCASPANCLAVGATSPVAGRGHPLAERWNGKSWRTVAVRLPAGFAFGDLLRLSCLSATFCVAAGDYGNGSTGHLLAEFWNGRTWTPTAPPAPAGGSGQTLLLGVSCTSARSCVAAGTIGNSGIKAITEIWNGAKWTRVNPPLPRGTTISALESVSCPSAKHCVAVGLAGSVSTGVLVESWNGTAWHISRALSPSGGFAQLTGVSCASAATCVAVGSVFGSKHSVALTETWNGKAWAMARVPWPKGTSDSELIGVSCPAKAYCVAVGDVGDNPQAGLLNTGKAVAARWNGKAWALQSVPAPAKGKASAFYGVSCRSTASCAAVGSIGPVEGTTSSSLSGFWNGKTWKLVPAV
jgi:hypothetical protein